MEPLGPQRTAIEVRFYLPEHRPDRLAALGEKYRASYARLWDQDEAMMVAPGGLLARSRVRSRVSGASLALGPISELRSRLPLLVELDGEPFRILELEGGELVAHSTICPHWLGPLDEACPGEWRAALPWHGYRFDLRTGVSVDGRGCRLAPAPRVFVDPVTGEVSLCELSIFFLPNWRYMRFFATYRFWVCPRTGPAITEIASSLAMTPQMAVIDEGAERRSNLDERLDGGSHWFGSDRKDFCGGRRGPFGHAGASADGRGCRLAPECRRRSGNGRGIAAIGTRRLNLYPDCAMFANYKVSY